MKACQVKLGWRCGGRAVGKFGEIAGIFILARHMEETSQTQKLKENKGQIVIAEMGNVVI